MKPETEQAEQTASESSLLRARKQLQAAEQKLAEERSANAAIVAEHRAMLQSRSWKITAPLRRAMSLFQRQPPATPARPVPAASPPTPGLPARLLRPQGGDVDADNASCRLLDLGAGLEGVVDETVNIVLAVSPADTLPDYLGWRAAPPTIAFIGSRELQSELAFDARVLSVREDDWESQLSGAQPRFLLIETVWHVEHRHWRYAMVRDGHNGELLRLLAHCRRIGLPVVVWYRETPAHLPQFAWLAEHADLMCAVDQTLATALSSAYPNARVHCLPPAIQPALHNPLRNAGLRDAARDLGDRTVFDGWWDLRKGQMPEMPVLRDLRAHRLLVAESHWDFGRTRLDDCPDFRDQVIGCLRADEKLALSRVQGAEVFAAEPLAGAWRSAQAMARTAACGSLVARLDGTPPWFADPPRPTQPGPDVLTTLRGLMDDALAGARQRHLTWRTLMQSHTVAHRLQAISDLLAIDGAGFAPATPRIACLMATMRPDRLEQCLQRFRDDAYPHRELVVVLHGDDLDAARYRSLLRDGEPVRILQMGSSQSLGACLNRAAAHTDAPCWTKMDDDDIYGPSYLSDVMLYQRTGDHQVFGKPPMFNYLESSDELLWDPTWASYANYVHEATRSDAALVAGGTLGGSTRILRDVPFSERRRGGSDSDFVLRCHAEGLDVLAMDGFNFVRFRSGEAGFHTWQMPEDEAKRRSLSLGGSDTTKLALV